MIYTIANTVKIGKPVRVFVNDNEVENAMSADTSRGVVVYVPQPIRVKKGADYIYTRKLRGKVTVEPY